MRLRQIVYPGDMPRPRRAAEGGLIYHALNRANGRSTVFETDDDYAAFERVMAQAVARQGMRLLADCLMPNHFHLLLWPRADGDLSAFMRWLTLTHTQRWHAHRSSAGTGHLYQGRFKSFVVQSDEHFLTVCRYVERNALRANLVERAEDWRWGSLWARRQGARRKAAPNRVADRPPAQLGGTCQSAIRCRRGGRGSAEHSTGAALRICGLAGKGDRAARVRVGIPSPRSSPQG